MSESVYSVGSSSQIRCGASPCPNFTTRLSSSEPCIAHGCSSRHTTCDRRHTCAVWESRLDDTWVGFDSWMAKRLKRSEKDAAKRARNAKACRERFCSPRPSEPSAVSIASAGSTTSAGSTAITVSTAIVGNTASPGNTAILGNTTIAVTSTGGTAPAITTASAGSLVDRGRTSVPDQPRRSPHIFGDESPRKKKPRKAAAPSKKKGGLPRVKPLRGPRVPLIDAAHVRLLPRAAL